MRSRLFCALAFMVSVSMTGNAADRVVNVAVLRAHSPDKKFAMQVVCAAEHADAAEIPGHAVQSVSLVGLPEKKKVTGLISEDDLVGFGGLKLVWSADSQWCAFYSSTNRIGYTTIYRRKGDDFTKVANEEDLSAPNEMDKRNEHVSPIQWVKPGVLLLDHHIVPRDDGPEFHVQFTATYNAKAGKFRIGGVKKVGR